MVIRLRFEGHAIAGRGCMRFLPKGNPQQSRLVPMTLLAGTRKKLTRAPSPLIERS
jgi:hypothetical protein